MYIKGRQAYSHRYRQTDLKMYVRKTDILSKRQTNMHKNIYLYRKTGIQANIHKNIYVYMKTDIQS